MNTAAWMSDDLPLLDHRCPLPLDLPFTMPQAQVLGVSRTRMRTLHKRGLIRRVTQGVYAVAQAPDDIQFRAHALRLVISPGAVVTDRTAAWLHGIDLLERSARSTCPPISVFQSPGTRARRTGVLSGERMLLPWDITVVNGVQVTTALRTACDLGRLLWRFDALAAIDQYLRFGVTLDELLQELVRFKGYRGVIQLRILVPLGDARAESPPESALRLHWIEAGLPRPEPQWWVCDDDGTPIFRLDLALPEAFFAAEYDGLDFHSSKQDREYDGRRRLWLKEQRNWHMEVFVNSDVYPRNANPGQRLRAGLVAARRALSTPIGYPTLHP